MTIQLRDWATPLVAGSFLLMATTGILIFFHLDSGLNKVAHEWLGWAFVIGAIAHLVSNFPAFQKRLQNKLSKIIIGTCATLLLLSFAPVGGEGGGGSVVRSAMEAVNNAPLTTVAQLVGKDANTLLADLQAAGVKIDTVDQSISSVTGGEREEAEEALHVIFKK